MYCREKSRIIERASHFSHPLSFFVTFPPEIFMTTPYRMLIVAHPGLMRRSLRAVLATFPTIELIGEADGCLSAKLMSETLKPDILLIAAGLPEKEIVMLLQEIQKKDQHKPYVIALVNTSGQRQAVRAARANAVLWQSDSTRQLADALKRFQVTQTSSQSSF